MGRCDCFNDINFLYDMGRVRFFISVKDREGEEHYKALEQALVLAALVMDCESIDMV